MTRRSFLKQVVDKIDVSKWPRQTATSLSRRNSESETDPKARRAQHAFDVMAQRVSIKFKRSYSHLCA